MSSTFLPWLLIGINSGALLALFWILSKMAVKLDHLAALSGGLQSPSGEESGGSPVEVAAGGAFEAFLNEDSTRRSMAKSDQFAAYRQWRKEKGMNWSR